MSHYSHFGRYSQPVSWLVLQKLNLTQHPQHKNATQNKYTLEMWANAERDGRPAEYRWRPLLNAAKFG